MEFCKRMPIGVPAGMVIAGTGGFIPKPDATRDANGAEESEFGSGAAACGFDDTTLHPVKRPNADNDISKNLKERLITYTSQQQEPWCKCMKVAILMALFSAT